jgi:hypothetical protein
VAVIAITVVTIAIALLVGHGRQSPSQPTARPIPVSPTAGR